MLIEKEYDQNKFNKYFEDYEFASVGIDPNINPDMINNKWTDFYLDSQYICRVDKDSLDEFIEFCNNNNLTSLKEAILGVLD